MGFSSFNDLIAAVDKSGFLDTATEAEIPAGEGWHPVEEKHVFSGSGRILHQAFVSTMAFLCELKHETIVGEDGTATIPTEVSDAQRVFNYHVSIFPLTQTLRYMDRRSRRHEANMQPTLFPFFQRHRGRKTLGVYPRRIYDAAPGSRVLFLLPKVLLRAGQFDGMALPWTFVEFSGRVRLLWLAKCGTTPRRVALQARFIEESPDAGGEAT